MKLSTAASFFDKVPCADAAGVGAPFYGQLDVFDDSKRDGVTVGRRVLSVRPGTILPASRVLTIDGAQWLVGTYQTDYFRGSPLRVKYVLHRALGVAGLKTVGELLSTGGVSTWAAKVWVKDFKEIEVSSSLEGFFNIFLPLGLALAAGKVITLDGRVHLIRNFFTSAAGFGVAECSELPADCQVSGTYTGGTYNPVTDSHSTSNTAVDFLRVRFQDDYAYATEASPGHEAGDLRAYVRKTVIAQAKAGDTVTIASVVWRVQTVSDEGDAWGLHLRRA